VISIPHVRAQCNIRIDRLIGAIITIDACAVDRRAAAAKD
jgi:hypothetical protein